MTKPIATDIAGIACSTSQGSLAGCDGARDKALPGPLASTAFVVLAAGMMLPSHVSAMQKAPRSDYSISASKASAPRRDGDSFVYADGTRVRATDPSGRAGSAGNDGTIRYADGTSFSYDGRSGIGTVRHADGSVTYAGPNAPRRDGDSYVYGDGMRVRATDHDGSTGEVQKDGSILYADGTRVSHDSRSGDTKIVHAGGRVEVVTANTPARDGDVFVFSDGYRVRATDDEGRAGQVGADGTISYADGTPVSHDIASGDTKVVHADGRVDVHSGNAPTRTGEEYVWRDGTRSVAFDRQGREGKIGSDGIVTFPDGSRISHDNATGVSKIVRADGTVELTQRDGSRESGSTPVGVPGELGRRGESASGASNAALGRILGTGANGGNSGQNNSVSGNNRTTGGAHGAGVSARGGSAASNKGQQNTGSGDKQPSRASSTNRDTSNRSSNTQNERSSNSSSSSDRSSNTISDRTSNADTADRSSNSNGSNKNQGRMVLGWSDNNGRGPSIAGTVDLAGQPGNDGAAGGATGRGTAQVNRRWAIGPGASDRGLGSTAQQSPIFDSKGLVVNPSPYEQTPDGERRDIDPYDGTR